MKKYSDYVQRREALLKQAKRAGIGAPARHWPKLSRANFDNGIFQPYWEQEDSMKATIELAEFKNQEPRGS